MQSVNSSYEILIEMLNYKTESNFFNDTLNEKFETELIMCMQVESDQNSVYYDFVEVNLI